MLFSPLMWMSKDLIRDLTEWIRTKLNSLPEKDNQGNNYRVGWQVLTYLVASAAEESTDPKIRKLGKAAKKGAIQSFIDLLANKLGVWLSATQNNPYQLSKSCNHCGSIVNSWNNYCPYCFNKI